MNLEKGMVQGPKKILPTIFSKDIRRRDNFLIILQRRKRIRRGVKNDR
jgi:hypothetical protein|tara:strand:+ start:62 stop:205 length:144 start_codon:yes stop_codon:yes gene_type:complete